jgi:signal transduction histidine kinase
VAHEFNNILTPTVSYCQMALASPQDHPLALKALRKAEIAATRATEISAAILGFAKPSLSPPGSSLDHQAANISSAVNTALACLSRDLNKDNIGLRLDIDPVASVRIRPVALQQVFLNLILNARRAMIPRGGTLTFHTEPHTTALTPSQPAVVGGCAQILDQPRGTEPRLLIRVSDTGTGMTKETLRRLFVPFSNQSGHGSGLGLVVCLKLIQDAGGAVIVESEPGKGTSITMCLYSVDCQT